MARLKTAAPAADDDPPGRALYRIPSISVDTAEVRKSYAFRVISDAVRDDPRVIADRERARDLDRPHWPFGHEASDAHLHAVVSLTLRSVDAYTRATGEDVSI